MSSQHTPEVGRLIRKDDNARRDAIHIALEPVIAGEDLLPGDHIGFVDGEKTTMARVHNTLAIVDPLLKGTVKTGEMFWAWVYPGTVTSLRHEWEHPGFGASRPTASIKESFEWLTYFAAGVGLTYQDVIDAGSMYQDHDELFVQHGSEDAREAMYDDVTKLEFWKHFAVVTGKNVTSRDSPFSCSC